MQASAHLGIGTGPLAGFDGFVPPGEDEPVHAGFGVATPLWVFKLMDVPLMPRTPPISFAMVVSPYRGLLS
jgi:hypothetical protein